MNLRCTSSVSVPTRPRYTRSLTIASETDDGSQPEVTATTTEEPQGILKVILSRQEAQSLLTYRRRRRRGVYDECCKKACAYKELTAYCAQS
ncbi:Insulin/IGF/Relaxin family [Popillia japonica]|uniref:Insulin/IGF/Relaxin family n=1 Tax=Popillia japonica TaxID=7064 RepID=A0AAW1M1D2_POPJA